MYLKGSKESISKLMTDQTRGKCFTTAVHCDENLSKTFQIKPSLITRNALSYIMTSLITDFEKEIFSAPSKPICHFFSVALTARSVQLKLDIKKQKGQKSVKKIFLIDYGRLLTIHINHKNSDAIVIP